MKRCNKCKEIKPINEFGSDKPRKDGLQLECKSCQRESSRRWYDAHRKEEHERASNKYRNNTQKILNRLREWRNNNAEYIRKWREENPKYHQKWYKENPEKVLEYGREWRKNNPDKKKANTHLRLALKTGNGGSFTAEEWHSLCARYDNRCLCCGEKKKLEADHVIPLVKGGTSNIDNIQPLCRSCNSSKRAKEIDYRPAPASDEALK